MRAFGWIRGWAIAYAILARASSGQPSPSDNYDYFVVGNPADVSPPTRAGLALVGGGTDVDDVYRWMAGRGGGGDFVVLRAVGDDAYNPYIFKLGGMDSVETLVIKNREAADDPFVVSKIRAAEAIYISGGDQSRYVKFWKGTETERAIEAVAAKPAPVGGTSAGLAILGQFSFAAMLDTIRSPEALANPYGPKVTLADQFLTLLPLEGLMTDSHFVERDRMGRLLVFLARLETDGLKHRPRAVGIDRETAVLVEPDGRSRVIGNATHPTRFAYFVQAPGKPERCVAGQPLLYRDVPVYRVGTDGAFNITSWTGTSGVSYTLTAEAGRVRSSRPDGSIY
jgi:cyanophycinase